MPHFSRRLFSLNSLFSYICKLRGITIHLLAIKNARERERRTLLRAMNGKKVRTEPKNPKIGDRSREGDLFPATSIDEYVKLTRQSDGAEDDEDFI